MLEIIYCVIADINVHRKALMSQVTDSVMRAHHISMAKQLLTLSRD